MGLEWYPETPEEIAEYQRMRHEWQKYQQERNKNCFGRLREPKKPVASKRIRGRLKVFVALMAVFFCFLGIAFFASSEKVVPVNASYYIQQTKAINESINYFYKMLEEDFVDRENMDYARYEQIIETTLMQICALKERSIFPLSAFYEYLNVCEVYYSRVYDYLNNVKKYKSIDVDVYSAFARDIARLENPQVCLEKLFKKHGYYYYKDDEGILHYKTASRLSLVS